MEKTTGIFTWVISRRKSLAVAHRKAIPLAVTEEENKHFKITLYSFPGKGCASKRN